MKATTAVLVLSAVALLIAPYATASRNLLATSTWASFLSGGEVLPYGSVATGAGRQCNYYLEDDNSKGTFKCLLTGPLGPVNDPNSNVERRINAVHIHLGAQGTAGPRAASLLPAPVTQLPYSFSGTITLEPGYTNQQVFSAIKSAGAYTDVHTVGYPGGELRGQIWSCNGCTL